MRAVLLGLVLLGGCASGAREHALPADLRDSLAGREISVSKQAPPSRFELQGASRSEGYVVLGAVRGNVGVAAGGGKPLTRDPVLRLDDPAEKIGRVLGERLQGKFSLRPGGGGLVLYVQTTKWEAALADPATSARYRVTYQATARLVDSKDGRELAESRCDARLDTATFEELVANDGARLNADLARAGEHCIAALAARMFG